MYISIHSFESVVVVVVSASHLCHVTCSVFFPVGKGIDPPYSASDWLTLMLFPSNHLMSLHPWYQPKSEVCW